MVVVANPRRARVSALRDHYADRHSRQGLRRNSRGVAAEHDLFQHGLEQWLRRYASWAAARWQAFAPKRVGKHLELVAKGPMPPKETGDIPGEGPVIDELRELLLQFGLREAAEAGRASAGRVIIPESLINDAIKRAPIRIQWFERMVNGAEQRVRDITEAQRDMVRESVRRIIADGQGESVGEIARRIRTQWHGDAYVFSSDRAALIAQTEANISDNAGIYAGYEASGVEALQWLRMGSGNPGRRRHDLMDEETVEIGELFVTPLGNKMRHPGDSSAPAEELARCTCTTAPVLRGKK